MVPFPKPAAERGSGGFTEEGEFELSDLAGAVWMINCDIDVNYDRERLSAALSHVERCLRRLSGQVGDNERRSGGLN